MASEQSSATAGEQPVDQSHDRVQAGDYPATGFHPLDKWSKLLLGLIVLFSLGIFLPVLANRGLEVMGAPWLFHAYPISIITLTIIWLILTYTVVD